eukprot:g5391.t1
MVCKHQADVDSSTLVDVENILATSASEAFLPRLLSETPAPSTILLSSAAAEDRKRAYRKRTAKLQHEILRQKQRQKQDAEQLRALEEINENAKRQYGLRVATLRQQRDALAREVAGSKPPRLREVAGTAKLQEQHPKEGEFFADEDEQKGKAHEEEGKAEGKADGEDLFLQRNTSTASFAGTSCGTGSLTGTSQPRELVEGEKLLDQERIISLQNTIAAKRAEVMRRRAAITALGDLEPDRRSLVEKCRKTRDRILQSIRTFSSGRSVELLPDANAGDQVQDGEYPIWRRSVEQVVANLGGGLVDDMLGDKHKAVEDGPLSCPVEAENSPVDVLDRIEIDECEFENEGGSAEAADLVRRLFRYVVSATQLESAGDDSVSEEDGYNIEEHVEDDFDLLVQDEGEEPPQLRGNSSEEDHDRQWFPGALLNKEMGVLRSFHRRRLLSKMRSWLTHARCAADQLEDDQRAEAEREQERTKILQARLQLEAEVQGQAKELQDGGAGGASPAADVPPEVDHEPEAPPLLESTEVVANFFRTERQYLESQILQDRRDEEVWDQILEQQAYAEADNENEKQMSCTSLRRNSLFSAATAVAALKRSKRMTTVGTAASPVVAAAGKTVLGETASGAASTSSTSPTTAAAAAPHSTLGVQSSAYHKMRRASKSLGSTSPSLSPTHLEVHTASPGAAAATSPAVPSLLPGSSCSSSNPSLSLFKLGRNLLRDRWQKKTFRKKQLLIACVNVEKDLGVTAEEGVTGGWTATGATTDAEAQTAHPGFTLCKSLHLLGGSTSGSAAAGSTSASSSSSADGEDAEEDAAADRGVAMERLPTSSETDFVHELCVWRDADDRASKSSPSPSRYPGAPGVLTIEIPTAEADSCRNAFGGRRRGREEGGYYAKVPARVRATWLSSGDEVLVCATLLLSTRSSRSTEELDLYTNLQQIAHACRLRGLLGPTATVQDLLDANLCRVENYAQWLEIRDGKLRLRKTAVEDEQAVVIDLNGAGRKAEGDAAEAAPAADLTAACTPTRRPWKVLNNAHDSSAEHGEHSFFTSECFYNDVALVDGYAWILFPPELGYGLEVETAVLKCAKKRLGKTFVHLRMNIGDGDTSVRWKFKDLRVLARALQLPSVDSESVLVTALRDLNSDRKQSGAKGARLRSDYEKFFLQLFEEDVRGVVEGVRRRDEALSRCLIVPCPVTPWPERCVRWLEREGVRERNPAFYRRATYEVLSERTNYKAAMRKLYYGGGAGEMNADEVGGAEGAREVDGEQEDDRDLNETSDQQEGEGTTTRLSKPLVPLPDLIRAEICLAPDGTAEWTWSLAEPVADRDVEELGGVVAATGEEWGGCFVGGRGEEDKADGSSKDKAEGGSGVLASATETELGEAADKEVDPELADRETGTPESKKRKSPIRGRKKKMSLRNLVLETQKIRSLGGGKKGEK